MNMRQLEVFMAVATKGSFTAAAEAMLLSQSTLSQHLMLLEEELDVVLFDRTRKGVRLTEAGKLFHAHALRVMSETRAATEAMRRYRGMEIATLKVAASNIPGVHIAPSVLSRLAAAHPSMEMSLIIGDSRQVAEAVLGGEAEVGIAGVPFAERGLASRPVGRDEICLIVPPSHPWALAGTLSPLDLPGGRFIIREEGSGTGSTVREALLASGVEVTKLPVIASVSSNEAVKEAVAAGLGVAFVSEISIKKEAERRDVAVVPVRGVSIVRPFYLVKRSGHDLSPAAQAFWDGMEEALGPVA